VRDTSPCFPTDDIRTAKKSVDDIAADNVGNVCEAHHSTQRTLPKVHRAATGVPIVDDPGVTSERRSYLPIDSDAEKPDEPQSAVVAKKGSVHVQFEQEEVISQADSDLRTVSVRRTCTNSLASQYVLE